MKKNSLLTILLVIAIAVIILMGEIIYKYNKNQPTEIQPSNNMDIQIGTYKADEETVDGAGVSYEDCGVTFAENNLCSVYEGYGQSHLGTYSIEGNKLECNTLISRNEEGGLSYNEGNIIYEFEIINSNQLKLVKVTNNSKALFDTIGLSVGMTYSFSKDSKIIVLVEKQ